MPTPFVQLVKLAGILLKSVHNDLLKVHPFLLQIFATGARERNLKKDGLSYHACCFPYSKVDRAITEIETTG